MGLGKITHRQQEGHTAEMLMTTGAMMGGTQNETFAQLMMAEQTSVLTVEQREFITTHNQIIDCGKLMYRSSVEFCRKLKEMRDGKSYRVAGFATFEEYVEDAVGIGRSQAYKYINVAEKLPDAFLEENAGLGISKLYLLTTVTETEREELQENVDLAKAGKAEIEDAVKEIRRERDEAQKQLSALGEEVDSLKTELDERDEALKALQDAYVSEKAQVRDAKELEKELRERIAAIELERDEARLDASRVTVQTVPDEETAKAAKAAEARAEELENELKATREQLAAAQAKMSTRVDKIEESESLYDAKVLFEASIDVAGSNYLVIYGKHVNGYFCAIPNWKIACEMSNPEDTFYNFERLLGAGIEKDAIAKELVKRIKDIALRGERK